MATVYHVGWKKSCKILAGPSNGGGIVALDGEVFSNKLFELESFIVGTTFVTLNGSGTKVGVVSRLDLDMTEENNGWIFCLTGGG